MITVPAGVRVYLGMGPTDMRKGIDGLSMLVQELFLVASSQNSYEPTLRARIKRIR
jgi:hypothetical protein